MRQQVIELLYGLDQGKEAAEAGTAGRGGEAGNPSTSPSTSLVLDQSRNLMGPPRSRASWTRSSAARRKLERVMQVLSRRTKNNPVLIGEPGVGKTAVVEGLAQADRPRRGPRDAEGQAALHAGPRIAGGRQPLPR